MEKVLYLWIFAIVCFIILAIIFSFLHGSLSSVISSISNVVIR